MVSKQALEIECVRLQERHQEHPEGRVFAPLADVLRKLGRLDEAASVCEEGLGRHPQYSSAHVILGKIRMERGESEDAARAFQRVLEIDDENLLALRHLAHIHEEAGAPAQALELWRRVRRIEPESDEVEERIAELERRLDPVAASPAEIAEETAVEDMADDAGEGAEPEATEATAESEGDEEPEEDEEAASPRPSGGASSAEIATITLAQIYYEQGFLAKALEVFEQIHARNPQLEGLEERIASIREELHRQSAPRPQRPSEADLDDLAPAREEPIARNSSEALAPSADDDVAVETEPEEPMTRRMRAESEKERFENFRRWLDGISADENRDSG